MQLLQGGAGSEMGGATGAPQQTGLGDSAATAPESSDLSPVAPQQVKSIIYTRIRNRDMPCWWCTSMHALHTIPEV
jgi:hypothetical protein